MHYEQNLIELAKKYSTDKKMHDGIRSHNGVHGHGYVLHYERILKNKIIKNLLEIGVSFGNSILMWDEYFDYKCNITGVEIKKVNYLIKKIENERIKIKIGDQSDVDFLKTLGDKKYDLIIDDGSHVPEHQIASFNVLFEFLNDGGIYVIEDLHVAKKTELIFKEIEDNKYTNNIINNNLVKDILKVEFFCRNKLCIIYKK